MEEIGCSASASSPFGFSRSSAGLRELSACTNCPRSATPGTQDRTVEDSALATFSANEFPWSLWEPSIRSKVFLTESTSPLCRGWMTISLRPVKMLRASVMVLWMIFHGFAEVEGVAWKAWLGSAAA